MSREMKAKMGRFVVSEQTMYRWIVPIRFIISGRSKKESRHPVLRNALWWGALLPFLGLAFLGFLLPGRQDRFLHMDEWQCVKNSPLSSCAF